MNEIDHATEAAWTALMTKSRVLLEAVETSLKSAGYPPIAWYDALLELEKAGPDGLRPFELKDRILLPQYGTSRLLNRMVKAGLVNRQDCLEDGRGQNISISEKPPESNASSYFGHVGRAEHGKRYSSCATSRNAVI